jgi:hypothetical protein
MKKINLILSRTSHTSFHNDFIGNIIKEYFNILYIDCATDINKENSILVVNCMDIVNNKPLWCNELYQQGYKIVVDSLWCLGDYGFERAYNLSNKNWFWYHESLLAIHNNYHVYVPNKKYNKLGLMPMGLIKQSHDLLFARVNEYLDDFVYSYIQRIGKYLPDDLPPMWTDTTNGTGQHQRYFNPKWYDDTYFSLVSETVVDDNSGLHITEKTFKPIAFQHPYLLWAQPGVLKHLKSLGFETYENLFDESYDSIIDINQRLDIVVDNIKNFNKVSYDQLTLEKIKHNHNLFFNIELIRQRMINEIVTPILEWVEAKQ